MKETTEYLNHWTGEKRIVQRKKLPGAIGKQHLNATEENDPDIMPLQPNIYSNIPDKRVALGSMIWLEETGMVDNLLARGNTIEDVVGFFRDIIKACKKFKVELTPKFNRIAKELES